MKGQHFAAGCLVVALAAAPGPAAPSDALIGGIVGGVIGGMIGGATQNRSRPQTTQQRTPRAAVPDSTRQANREMQTALNYFGFPVGNPDGVVGRNTRNGISNFQSFMGYPATGQLTEYERNFLVGSYQRAIAGGPVTAQMAATNPMGPRGLLLQWRDELAGGTTMAGAQPFQPQPMQPQPFQAQGQTMQPGPVPTVPAPAVPGVMAALPQAPGADAGAQTVTRAAPLPVPEAATPAQPAPAPVAGLPNFLGDLRAQASLASHCNRVSLVTNSNGGFTTLATMNDPAFVLEEQFCLARIYAIADGEEMAARVPGVTPAQITAQCAGLGVALRPQVATLGFEVPTAVLQQVASFIVTTGMAPAQLEGSARICLSSGYRSDEMEVALGAALLLVTVGERAYAELVGHHLAQGFGTGVRPDLALEWYDMGLAAVAAGARTPFLPGQPERLDLLRAATDAFAGRAGLPAMPGMIRAVQSGMPGFALPEAEPRK